MIKINNKGSFRNTERFFDESKNLPRRLRTALHEIGRRGVLALQEATPKDTGKTAYSWSYTVGDFGVGFNNSNVNDGYSVALLIQYGHGTKGGSFVTGIDFINPALSPVFKEFKDLIDAEIKKI